MKMLPVNSDDLTDASSINLDVEPSISPFKRGIFIGLAIVILFWLGLLILGAALLMFH
jgi:hypothetical protein